MEKHYKVWLTDAYSRKRPVFDSISSSELDEWLRENAELFSDNSGNIWWIAHNKSDSIRDDIPYSGMGYIVNFEVI